ASDAAPVHHQVVEQVRRDRVLPTRAHVFAMRDRPQQRGGGDESEQPLGAQEMEVADHDAPVGRTVGASVDPKGGARMADQPNIASEYAISRPTARPSGYWNRSRLGRHVRVFWFAGVMRSSVA